MATDGTVGIRTAREHHVALRGVKFAALTEEQTVDMIIEEVRQHHGGWVSTPNISQLEQINESLELQELVEDASLVVADGMPLVWASQIQGTPLPERVAGSNLVWSLAGAAADAGASLFLLGGDDGVAPRAQAVLEREIPGLRVVGTHTPPVGFEHNPEQTSIIAEKLETTHPDVVYVGLGFPKQERLIRELTRRLPGTWFLGIGMSLSFISGDVQRSPRWMQKLGLEWGHRLLSEPRRLFRRYIVDGIPFTLGLLVRSCAARARADIRIPWHIS
jgi:N-acetylglucosaminyldiphosphoundecaprenol N-acetyl-beta-D-mannosaminyltransferase